MTKKHEGQAAGGLTDDPDDEVSYEVISPEVVESLPYTIGAWGGLPQWRCKFCPWDTLDGEAAALLHYRDRHAPPAPAPKPPVIPVYDRWGNEVRREP